MDQNHFNFSGKAAARNSDHERSHIAADSLNALDSKKLKQRQGLALRGLRDFGGASAKDIGLLMACKLTGCTIPQAELIAWIATVPHKRMKNLISKGYARIDEDGDCFITEKGLKKLRR